MRRLAHKLVFVGATATICALAYADSVRLPKITPYFSENEAFRFTVVPREPWWLEQYLPDRVSERTVAGQILTGAKLCRGVLERKLEGDRYEVVWDRQLSNEKAPGSALVADDGSFVVTFDNWGERGYGHNVVVIYDAAGDTVRELALSDFLAEERIAQLTHTVSQIIWGGEHYLEESLLVLRTMPPGPLAPPGARHFHEIRIRLADGSLIGSTE